MLRAALAVLLAALPGLARAQAPFVEYRYDDGSADINHGPPSTFDADMLWGNVFERVPGGEVVSEIAVAFGPTFPTGPVGPVTLWLLGLPGGLDPRPGAEVLATATVTPTVFGNTFTRVSIAPTAVPETFFVGASAFLRGREARARVDRQSRADRSWFFYAPDIAAVVGALGTAPFGTRMDDATQVPVPGAFMVRAVASAAPTPAAPAPDGPPAARLLAPAPSPGRTPTVRFELAAPEAVRVDVLDALGRAVAVLADGPHAAGAHAVPWDARGLPAGVYTVRLRAGGAVRTARTVVGP